VHELEIFLTEHRWLLAGISLVSILLLASTVLATPWLLSRLPSDYFVQDSKKNHVSGIRQWLWHALLNILGLLVSLLGITMMFTPGPGLVVLLAGLSLMRLPAKDRLIRAIAAKKGIFESMNRLRQHRSHPPFLHPDTRKKDEPKPSS